MGSAPHRSSELVLSLLSFSAAAQRSATDASYW